MKYLLIIIFSLYILVVALFSLQEYPELDSNNYFVPFLTDRPLTEDGFYSLKVAYNIGISKGIVYNYDQPTTGIQPLFVFVTSALSYINNLLGGDKFTFLRLIILFSGIVSVILATVIKSIAEKILPAANKKILIISSILLVQYNFKIFLNLFNGLETGIYLVLLGLCINYSFSLLDRTITLKSKIIFGLLLGITTLARIDFIIIGSVFLICLRIINRTSLKDLILPIIVASIVVLPWFIYVYSVQGNVIPTSALVQSTFQTAEVGYRINQFIFSLTSNVVPFFHTGFTQTYLFFPVATVIMIILIKFHKENLKLVWKNDILQSWLVGLVFISIVYLLFAAQPYFYFRYLSIWSTLTLPFLVLLFMKWISKKSNHIFNLIITSIVLYFFINVLYYLHFPKPVSGLALRPAYIQNHFNGYNKIGMAQSGISGYFFDNVINLDGKVNAKALEAIKSSSINNYIQEEKIDVLIEWKEWFEIQNKKWLFSSYKRYFPDVADGKSIVYIINKIK